MDFRGQGSNFIFSDGKRNPILGLSAMCSCSIEDELFEGQGCFFISSTDSFSAWALSLDLCPADFLSSYLCLHDLVGIYWGPDSCQLLSMDKRYSSKDTADWRQSDKRLRWVSSNRQTGWWVLVRRQVCAREARGWGIENSVLRVEKWGEMSHWTWLAE